MLLWIEGFDNFGTTINGAPSPTGVVGRKYPWIGNEAYMDIKEGRYGGYAIQLQWDATCYLGSAPLTTDSTLIIGCAVRFDAWPSTTRFLSMYDDSVRGMNVRVTSGGQLAVYRGDTLLATTSSAGIVTGAWFYLEFKVTCSDTGSYELRVNGVNVLSDTGVDTKAGSDAYHSRFQLSGTATNDTAVQIDDLYVADGSGGANNDFLGNMRVRTIRPDAAGDTTEFTPDSGSNYARVGEEVCDDDASYVQDGTSGHTDLYNYSSIPVSASVVGIQINTDCRETDAESFTLRTVCKSGLSTTTDAGQAIGASTYVTKGRLMVTDPDTSAAWTASGINDAQFGIRVE